MSNGERDMTVRPYAPGDPVRVRRVILEASALGQLELGRDPVKTLQAYGRDRLRADPTSRLAHIFATADRVSRKELSDLLYEMARACLLNDVGYEYGEDVRWYAKPQAVDLVTRQMSAVAKRARLEVDPALGRPLRSVPEIRPIEAAERCAQESLRVKEGAGGRFISASIAMRRGDFAKADEILNELAAADLGDWQRHVVASRMAALLRLDDADGCIALGRVALQKFPNDRLILINLAVAAAHADDRQELANVESRYRLSQQGVGDTDWYTGFVSRQLNWIAVKLDVPLEVIRQQFGERGGDFRR